MAVHADLIHQKRFSHQKKNGYIIGSFFGGLQKVFAAAVFLCSFLVCVTELNAQSFGPIEDRFNSLSQNSISSIEGRGSVLWMGPGLNAYFEISGEIYIPQNADSVFNARGRAFSLAVEGSRVFSGLGFTSMAGGEAAQAALGYYKSYNAGESWDFIPFPLDERPPFECDASSYGVPCDLEFVYGGETYLRTRITVPELSPPFEVDFFENTLLSVNWASGLLRSTDTGQTWERLILPPSSRSELTPDNAYEWFSQTSDGEAVNRYDPRFDNNLLGFGLLIDDEQRVWVGTAGGINISENALTAPKSEVSWRRISFEPENQSGLMADWIVAIREQPGTGRIWMTNWRTDPQNRDQSGIVYTDNHGETFQHFLEGIQVNDIGFWNDTVFAAADNGLYISKNNGISWSRVDQIRSANTFIREDARYFSVSATDNNLWVGTSDGLASTDDGGETWRIIRVDVPLRGGNIYQPDAPDVKTYAYPNPFSPGRHHSVRIKFEMEQAAPVSIRIFDFGMNHVRTLRTDANGPGSYEAVWDGRDERGRQAAGGTYFYVIEKPNGTDDGKILMLD